MSTLLFACAPPLMIFIIGTGIVVLSPRWRNSDLPFDTASALATANEMASSALAPSRLLFSVPSSLIIVSSTARWSANSLSISASRSAVLMLATAF